MSLKKYNFTKLLKELNKNKDSKEIIDFDNYNIARNLSDARRFKLISKLLILSSLTDKKLINLNKNDYFELIAKIKQRKVKPITIEDYKVVLKSFIKYHGKTELLKIITINNKIKEGNG